MLAGTAFGLIGRAARKAESPLSPEVAKHVYFALMLTVTLMQIGRDELWTHPMLKGVEPTYADCVFPRTDER